MDNLLLNFALNNKDDTLKYQTILPSMFTNPISREVLSIILNHWSSHEDPIEESDLIVKTCSRTPKNTHKEIELFIKSIYEEETAGTTLGSIIHMCKEKSFIDKVLQSAVMLEDNAHPDGSLADVWDSLCEEYDSSLRSADSEDEITATGMDIEIVLDKTKRVGVGWSLPTLDLACGPLLDDFIVVGARPDSGKTGFCLQQGIFMAKHLPEDRPIYFFRNEEGVNKVVQRAYMLALDMPWKDILLLTPEDIKDRAKAALGGENKILFYPKSSFSTHDVTSFLANKTPGAIIFDQLSKVELSGKHEGNDAMRIQKLAKFARDLTQEHTCPVFTTVWADGSAQNVEWISMEQLFGSKTGLQGEADVVMTLGRVDPSSSERSLFLPKNKMPGADNAYRNLRMHVKIDPNTLKFEEA